MIKTVSNRPTRAEIDLDVLASNFHSIREFIGGETRYMAVVKADAYGHGAIPCARRLEAEGIDWFGVAIPQEGVELRVKRHTETCPLSRRILGRAGNTASESSTDAGSLQARSG